MGKKGFHKISSRYALRGCIKYVKKYGQWQSWLSIEQEDTYRTVRIALNAGGVLERSHHRQVHKTGGDLSIDVAGPFEAGKIPTDQPTAKGPKYFLVGAYIPMSSDEAVDAATA